MAADGEGQSKPPRHATSDLTLFQQASEIFLEKMEGTFFGGCQGLATGKRSAASWSMPRGVTRQRLRFSIVMNESPASHSEAVRDLLVIAELS